MPRQIKKPASKRSRRRCKRKEMDGTRVPSRLRAFTPNFGPGSRTKTGAWLRQAVSRAHTTCSFGITISRTAIWADKAQAAWLVVIPKLHVVCARETAWRSQAPVFVLDPRPKFGVNARSRDGTRVPSIPFRLHRLRERFDAGFSICLGMARFAVLDDSSLVGRELPLHFLDDERQARLRVGLNGGGVVRAGATAGAAPAGGGGDAAESDIGAIALQQCRESRTDDGCLSSGNLQTQCVIVGCAGTG